MQALGQYDNNEFEESLKTFDGISDTSKILFNCGVIHATLGEHDKAVGVPRTSPRRNCNSDGVSRSSAINERYGWIITWQWHTFSSGSRTSSSAISKKL